jgi:flagellar protein FlbD
MVWGWMPQFDIMVTLTRLNGTTIVVNAELIEMLEATPDTVVTLTNGKKLLAKESVQVIVDRAIEYRRQTFRNLFCNKEGEKE